jgi:hypothetical protein
MSRHEQFLGLVRDGQFQVFAPPRLEGTPVNLSPRRKGEFRSVEEEAFDCSPYEGKFIVVTGQEEAGWIYSAEVVEEAGAALTDCLKKLLKKREDKPGEAFEIEGDGIP